MHEVTFFFVANFHNLVTKKGLANPTKGILQTLKRKSPYFKGKKLEVAKFRQCVHVCCQN